MKYFILADIHGYYDQMLVALDKAGYDRTNRDHFLISLGDAFDRGPKPREVMGYLLNTYTDRRALILGNHEDLMEQAICRHSFQPHDEHNGAIQTAKLITGADNEFDALIKLRNDCLYNDYIHVCQDYFETKNSIFVHGWIPTETINRKVKAIDDWRNASKDSWRSARWINGMLAWYNGAFIPNKTIYCGHWHCTWGKCYIDHTSKEFPNPYSTNPAHRVLDWSPFQKEGIVALDGCTAISGIVNCVVIEDEQINK